MSESSEIHTGWIQPPLQQKLSIQISHSSAPMANGESGCIADTSLPRFPFNGRAKNPRYKESNPQPLQF